MKQVLSNLEGWDLEDTESDPRGMAVEAESGQRLGRVRDLVIDTDKERVIAVTLENGKVVPLTVLERRDAILVMIRGAAGTEELVVSKHAGHSGH